MSSPHAAEPRTGSLPALFLKQLHLRETMPTGAPKAKRAGPPEGAPAPKATKKQHAGRAAPYQTVGAIGAGVGTIIRGLIPSDGVDVSDDSYAAVEGTSFRVVAGTVWAQPETQTKAAEAYPDGEWAAKLARFQGVRTSDAQMRIGRYAVTDDMAPRPVLPESLSGALIGMTSGYGTNVQNMRGTDGAEVELQVLTLGPKWSHLGLSIGDRIMPNALAHQLNLHFQDDETKIGFLCLRIHHWVEGKRSGRVSADAPARPIDEDVHALLFNDPEQHASALYDLEETTGPLSAMKRYRLPVSGDRPFTPDDAESVFDEMASPSNDVHPMMWPTLAHPSVSFGALKSLMQKIARFRPNKDVLFPTGYGINEEHYTVNARVVMLAATLLCLSTKGDGYLPDLHMSVRGATAACKRLAVIAVEDSWFNGASDRSPALRALLGLAMATMRMPDYHISHATATKVGRLATQVVASKQILAWSPKFARAPTGDVPATKAHMVRSAELLRILKSFEGDMQMFELAAELVSSGGRIKVIAMPEQLVHPDHMPLLHLIDQHVYRGVAHQVLDFPTTQPSNNAFGPRFRTLFHTVTGFNPRLASANPNAAAQTRGEHGPFDEARDPVPAVRRAQYQIGLEVFAHVYPKQPLPEEERAAAYEATVSIDPAIISQAVGPIKVPQILTSKQENIADYRDDSDPEKRRAAASMPTVWKGMIVLLGTRSSDEVVVFAPSRDTKPKPEITPTAKAKAIRDARAKSQLGVGLKFESRLMPFHTHARYDDDTSRWLVTSTRGAAPKFWSWDNAMAAELPFVVSPFSIPNEEGDPEWEAQLNDNEDGMAAAKKAILTARLENRYLTEAEAEDMQQGAHYGLVREPLQKLVKAIANVAEAQGFVPGNVLSRFLSMIAAQYTTFSVPVPGLQGGANEKELKPERGDWIVYRALLRLAALAPGAMQSSSPKKLAFVVNDARALKYVESQLRSIVRERDAPNAANDAQSATHWQTRWHKLLHNAEGGRTPFQFQKDLVQQMVDRDGSPNRTQGQFLSLEVGLGKTVTGMLYALQHLASTPNHGMQRIVWITKRAIVDTTVGELLRWRQSPIAAYKSVSEHEAIHAFGGNNQRLIVLAIETLSGAGSSETLAEKLIGMAPHTLFIVDEVHQYYTLSHRASRLLQAVSASPKFLVMTATPAASTRQMLAREWLRRCVNFPVASPDDVLVAGATFISGRYDLGIEAVEEEVFVRLSEDEYDAHKAALAVPGGWSKAASIVRDAIELKLAEVTVAEARRDRTANPGGGALVVVDSAVEEGGLMNKLVWYAGADFRVEMRHDVLNSPQPTDPNVGIIVVTKGDVTGYNLQRLGVIVTGVYAGNAAHRHQLRGRIRRLGQKRKEVKYVTVIGRSTILDLLHERHKSTDSQGATLEAMAALFLNQAEARTALGGGGGAVDNDAADALQFAAQANHEEAQAALDAD